MTRTEPILFVVDCERETATKLQEALRTKYGTEFRVAWQESAVRALESLARLRDDGARVALVAAAADMPQMDGGTFLERAAPIVPDAALLLYSTDGDAPARRAGLHIDACVARPWRDPEVCLYPALEGALEAFRATAEDAGSGSSGGDAILVICARFEKRAHAIRDFLARNTRPFQFLDLESDDAARTALERHGGSEQALPLVVLPEGDVLEAPSLAELAERLGLQRHARDVRYDLAIVGGGPAGLAAAVYGASEGLEAVVVEAEATGGQAGLSSSIENYLGFPGGLSGGELAQRATEQAERFGAEIVVAQRAVGLQSAGPERVVTLEDGSEVRARSVLIATGVAYRTLDAPGVDRLTGSGVYYGAARAEAYAYEGQDICLLGGGNSAGQAAMQFSRYARSVTIVTLDASLADTMSSYLLERIERAQNVRVIPGSTVARVDGETRLEAVWVRDERSGDERRLETNGLFVFIGGSPHTGWLEGVVALDEHGFVLSGSDLPRSGACAWPLEREPLPLESSVPGVFVAGDVRSGSVKRVGSAVGEGSMAMQFVHRFLHEAEEREQAAA